MALFFEMLFGVLPYIVMLIVGWFIADRLDEQQHQIDVMRKYINSHHKKFEALSKKPTKKK